MCARMRINATPKCDFITYFKNKLNFGSFEI